jgi:hypothetical protein
LRRDGGRGRVERHDGARDQSLLVVEARRDARRLFAANDERRLVVE